MSIRNTNTKVYFYKNDFNRVCAEIYRHPHIETGGNLFGHWTTERNVVVHAALGPGKNCKRTEVSFHQDIEYMSRVGTFLNQKFMLCHIGEWHSHHHLTLNEPSSGDKRTIRHNYPEGVKKFLVIIGNIVGNDRVVLSPYFFSEKGDTCEKGEFKVLDDADSPFTIDPMIVKEMNKGAENPNLSYLSSSLNNVQQQSGSEGNSSASCRSQPSATNISSNSGNRSPGTVPQNVAQPSSSGSYAEAGSGTRADKIPADLPTPYPDYPTTNSSSESEAESDDNSTQTRKEAILKKVFDEIKSRFHGSGIEIVRSSSRSGVIEMKFKHKDLHWSIRFPQSFPEKPASIFTARSEKFSDVKESKEYKPEFMNNYFDILLAIKRECRRFSSSCSACKTLNVQTLRLSDQTLDFFLTEEGNTMIKQLLDKAEDTLAEAGSLKKEMKCDDFEKNATLEVSFTHSSMLWIIEVSSTFPSGPAKVYLKNERQFFGGSPSPVRYDSDPYSSSMDWASTVLHAIRNKCCCIKCA